LFAVVVLAALLQHVSAQWAPSAVTATAPSEATVLFHLAPCDPRAFEAIMESSARIGSPHFGRRLSRSELQKLRFDPSGYDTVRAWLRREAADANVALIPNTRFLRVTAAKVVVERLVGCALSTLLRHKATGQEAWTFPTKTSDKETLSAAIQPLVTSVIGVGDLPVSRLPAPPPGSLKLKTKPPLFITPSYLRTRYNIQSSCSAGSNQSVAFDKYLFTENFSPADLAKFQLKNGLPAAPITIHDGVPNNATACTSSETADSCDESNLDAQYLTSTAAGCPAMMVNTAGPKLDNSVANSNTNTTAGAVDSDSGDAFGLGFLLLTDLEPQPISISYSISCTRSTTSFIQTFAYLLQEACALGFTIVVSSGDSGAQGFAGNCSYFDNSLLASPYVVVVGATQWDTAAYPSPDAPEVGMQCSAGQWRPSITSGGGFHHVYPRPAFQQNVTDAYLQYAGEKLELPAPAAAWNASGRGYPDVALLGNLYQVFTDGTKGYYDGSSASAPVFAGMVGLISDARVAVGKPPLGGWMSNLLDQVHAQNGSAVFNDILTGDNRCKKYNSNKGKCQGCCKSGTSGYFAAPGWDPVTGLGSVNFEALKAVLLAV
jgi:tripeptidyl-peptidase-1